MTLKQAMLKKICLYHDKVVRCESLFQSFGHSHSRVDTSSPGRQQSISRLLTYRIYYERQDYASFGTIRGAKENACARIQQDSRLRTA